MPDPEPLQTIGVIRGQCTVVKSNPHRMKRPDFFQPKGGMRGVALQQCEVLVRQFTNCVR